MQNHVGSTLKPTQNYVRPMPISTQNYIRSTLSSSGVGGLAIGRRLLLQFHEKIKGSKIKFNMA